ncbi:MAG: TIGR02757 family protein [Chitinophagales bacterium]|nr:TIGR02757 family protein [Chitinophagales bacterium]
MRKKEISQILDFYYEKCHVHSFVEDDPISIPHLFTKKQDIEIMGFFASILAWGQRKAIILNCKKLIGLMDGSPYDFILNHTDKDLIPFETFVHRTFNSTDLLGMIAFLKYHYQTHESLETAFSKFLDKKDEHVGPALIGFHHYVMSLKTTADRTKKHIATPIRKSACKKLNMYLRWMVRKDDTDIDFGIWNQIQPSQLLCPLDVHVDRNARKLGLIARKQTDWLAVLELTQNLKTFDKEDPVKYDFALFGMGVMKEIDFKI